MTPDDAAREDQRLSTDESLVFHISVSDVLSTMMAFDDRRHTEQERQEMLDWIIENRSMLREAILDVFGDFGLSDHHWSNAVELAVAEVKADELELEAIEESTPMRFQTPDGYVLVKAIGQWTDGDLTFDSDSAGNPIDASGERLTGSYLQ